MATITSTGLGSGMDINGIVDSLASINDRQVSLLKTQAATTQAKLSSFSLLSSYVDNLRDVGELLAGKDLWTSISATSSDSSSVSVSATSTATAANYSVQVTKLAQPQIQASAAYAAGSTASVGTNGTFKVSFADAAKPPLELTLSSSTTLSGLKDQINAANKGVSASIVSDASGARLVLSSGTTGNTGAMTISGTGDFAALAAGMSVKQAAQNAEATVNGIDVTSTTNTLNGVADGVTITLSKVTTSAVNLSVGADTAGIKKNINSFVSAYNDLAKYIAQQTKYDESTKKAGALQADRPTLTLQSNLRALVTGTSSASSTYKQLSDIGLEMQKDGTLKVNDTKLSAALKNNLGEVAKLFNATSADGSAQGFGTRAKALGDVLLQSDGAIASRTKSLKDSITRNEKEQEKLNARTEATKARLLKVYNAMDSQIAGYKNTAASLSQTITAMEASWKSDS